MIDSDDRETMSLIVRRYFAYILPTLYFSLVVSFVIFLSSGGTPWEITKIVAINLLAALTVIPSLIKILRKEDVLMPIVYFTIKESTGRGKAFFAIFVSMTFQLIVILAPIYRIFST